MPKLDVLVPVSDVPRACLFYCDLVGLASERVSDDFATLKAGDANVWLHREDDGAIDLSGVELWIGVDDVDAVHRRFVEAALSDLRPPMDVPQWGLRVASALDPDGRRVYVSSRVRPLSSSSANRS